MNLIYFLYFYFFIFLLMFLSEVTLTTFELLFTNNSEILSFAFFGLTILSPSCFSMSFLAFPAMDPPLIAIFLLSSNLSGFSFFDNSVVAVSANIFKTSSRFVMLSLKLSFLKLFNCLYSAIVLLDHAFVISFVNIAKSVSFFTPERFHSSVSSFLISIVLSL